MDMNNVMRVVVPIYSFPSLVNGQANFVRVRIGKACHLKDHIQVVVRILPNIYTH